MNFPNNRNNIDEVLDYLKSKYRFLDKDEARFIIEAFIKTCKTEILKGNQVRINRVGTFYSEKRPPMKSKTIYKKERIIPEMYVPRFQSASTFRRYVNGE